MKDSDSDHLDALSRRFMGLWQEQLAAIAASPEASALMGRFMTPDGGASLFPWFSAEGVHRGQSPNPAAPRAAAPAAAPDGVAEQLALVTRSLEAIAKRLDALEQRSEKPRPQPRAATGKSKPKRPAAKPAAKRSRKS